MDFKILDSQLRDFLETKAKPEDIAKAVSLTSASIEKLEQFGKDTIYHVEVTTNRADMASAIGLAREAGAALPRFGFAASVKAIQLPGQNKKLIKKSEKSLIIKQDKDLVQRICAVVMEVHIGKSPQFIKDRLEAAGIRSLNNVIDITNYVMLETGHPTHAMDYDRIKTGTLIVRKSKKGEKITTLDKKIYHLQGGDIVGDNGKGEIVDLFGIMGLENSVVTDETKFIIFLINTNDPHQIRKTSMGLGIRTDAAVLNEKDIDPELALTALKRGINLYETYAGGKIASDIIDIYPHPYKEKTITVTQEKIQQVIGLPITIAETVELIAPLGFIPVTTNKNSSTINKLTVTVPSWRAKDIAIEEDIIEEIARMYGYHNIPVQLPQDDISQTYHMENNPFYWENRIKEAMKYWGFTEVYTYSMVGKKQLDYDEKDYVTLANPLDADHVYMRKSLLPSLTLVAQENSTRENIQIFEIANVYAKSKRLPEEERMIAFLIKDVQQTFYHAKGIIEALAKDLGLSALIWREREDHIPGATILIGEYVLGSITLTKAGHILVEISCDKLVQHATKAKKFIPLAKYPPIIEDMAFIIDEVITTGVIIEAIQQQSSLIKHVNLLDQYKNKRTFHILYQDKEKNLSTENIAPIREKIKDKLEKTYQAKHI